MNSFIRWPRLAAATLCIAAMPCLQAADQANLALRWVDRGTLPDALAQTLEGMLAASLESTAAIRCVPQGEDAPVAVTLEASGRGRWKVRARLSAPGVSGNVTTDRASFDDRASVPEAVDRLASEIVELWNKHLEGNLPAPLPVARALSGDAMALDRYLDGLQALHAGQVDAAGAAFEQALARDPAFALAAAEQAFTRLTAGDPNEALEVLGGAGSLRDEAPLARIATRGLRQLVATGQDASGAAPALRLTDRIGLTWFMALKGLSAQASGNSDEALASWVAANRIDPGDPRVLYWLGVAHMSTGAFDRAEAAFAGAIDRWPGLMPARLLQAESLVRMRETERARAAILALQEWMQANQVAVAGDRSNPDLWIGSVDLMEGQFEEALRRFESAIGTLETTGAGVAVTGTLRRSVVQMRRDMIESTDPVLRRREVDHAMQALAAYEQALTPEEAGKRHDELLMLRGLILARAGDTVEAWKVAESMTRRDGEGFEATWLAGATMLKEGDLPGAIDRFRVACRLEGRTVDDIVTGQLEIGAGQRDAALTSLQRAEQGLRRYVEPWLLPGPEAGAARDLILTNPFYAAMVPVYHYQRARLAYLSGDSVGSRSHFNMMLKYYRRPDRRVQAMVNEALARGARPE